MMRSVGRAEVLQQAARMLETAASNANDYPAVASAQAEIGKALVILAAELRLGGPMLEEA
jgi:hypothetical protein